MALFVQPSTPSSPAPDDVWIAPNGNRQLWNGSAWVPHGTVLTPTDPGLLAGSGASRQRLAKVGSAYGAAEWGDAAGGIVFIHIQSTAADTWTITHGLLSRYVGVTVIDTARNLELVPEITYGSVNVCTLRFEDAVTGTALVRR